PDGSVTVWQGLRNGSVGPPATATIDATFRATQMVAADFNRDGYPDLVIADAAGGRLAIVPSLGHGTLATPVTTTIAPGDDFESLDVGDVNADGILDLLVLDRSTASVIVLFGNGGATFSPQPPVAVGAGAAAALVAGDLDRNGRLDAVLVDRTGGAAQVLRAP